MIRDSPARVADNAWHLCMKEITSDSHEYEDFVKMRKTAVYTLAIACPMTILIALGHSMVIESAPERLH